MSEDDQDQAEPEEAPNPEPKPLSREYHEARRNLNLASGLFFAWEFVGIDLASKEGASEIESTGFHFVIKSPGAVPWVLLVLVCFFLLRLWLEWAQCDKERKRQTPAQIDIGLSTSIAALSVAVFGYQQVTHVQLFSDLNTGRLGSFESGFVISSSLFARWRGPTFINEGHGRLWRWWSSAALIFGLTLAGLLVAVSLKPGEGMRLSSIGLVSGLSLGVFAAHFVVKTINRELHERALVGAGSASPDLGTTSSQRP